MSDAVASVFTQVPGGRRLYHYRFGKPYQLRFTSAAGACERCKERSYAEIIAEVNATIAQGVARGNPDAKVLVWDWSWDDTQVGEIIARLPKNCWLQSVSEWSLPITRGGVASTVGEYSISSVGPGPRAKKHWSLARAAGLKTSAKVQVGATWEFCSIPYLPTLDLVAEHACNLASAGVDGVMLSWSLGCYPSPNLEVFQAFTKETDAIGPVLDRVAVRRYGVDAAPLVAAWTAFSQGFREYPYHIGTVSNGPQHMGQPTRSISSPPVIGPPWSAFRMMISRGGGRCIRLRSGSRRWIRCVPVSRTDAGCGAVCCRRYRRPRAPTPDVS